MNQSGQAVKGSVVIAANQSTTSTSYVTLATPDQVASVVLATGGLILVWYYAYWQASIAAASSAAIFLGANQVQAATSGTGTTVQAAAGTGTTLNALTSTPFGLSEVATGVSGSDITTGQVLGSLSNVSAGPTTIFANAGTYTVSVRFKVSSGNLNVVNRRLYVAAISFA